MSNVEVFPEDRIEFFKFPKIKILEGVHHPYGRVLEINSKRNEVEVGVFAEIANKTCIFKVIYFQLKGSLSDSSGDWIRKSSATWPE